MVKTRVKYKIKGDDEIYIGYLVKNKSYKNGFMVQTTDKKSSYCISLLSIVEKI